LQRTARRPSPHLPSPTWEQLPPFITDQKPPSGKRPSLPYRFLPPPPLIGIEAHSRPFVLLKPRFRRFLRRPSSPRFLLAPPALYWKDEFVPAKDVIPFFSSTTLSRTISPSMHRVPFSFLMSPFFFHSSVHTPSK